MIVDVHVHLGWDYSYDEDFTKEDLLRKKDALKIDVQIVQPGTCHDLVTVKAQHDAIAGLAKEHPGRFFGMANPGPHLPRETYLGEVSRCVEELGFVGVKLNPPASGVIPASRSGRKAFDAARKYGIPVMVHTGSGFPFADPAGLLSIAEEYGDLNIIMAHSGMLVFAGSAGMVLERCRNVYGDTSWTPGFIIRGWEESIGPRMMFASDHADNATAELEKIRACGLSEEKTRRVLGGTAFDLFKLKGRV